MIGYNPQQAVLQQAAMPPQPGAMPPAGGAVPGQMPAYNPGATNPQAASVLPQIMAIVNQCAQGLGMAAQLAGQAFGPENPITQALAKFGQMAVTLSQALGRGGSEPAAPGGQMQAAPPTGRAADNAPQQ